MQVIERGVPRTNEAKAVHGHKVDANAPTLIGSMSKAITAVAIATLIRDGKLSFVTPMSQAPAEFFKRQGRPSDRRFEAVTIEQLLVHRSGMLGTPTAIRFTRSGRIGRRAG
jgi:CubicO group peptidase (beta-lactamase class C family)